MTIRLRDNFDDNIIDTALWPWNFGAVSETGGRARVGCSTAYSAYVSDYIYTLKESSVHARVFPPAAGGTAVEAWAQLVVSTPTDGTDALMEINAATGRLSMSSRVGYFDAGSVSIPYSATDHAWLRLREAAGTTHWETSPDGLAWTTRRSSTSPPWATDGNLKIQLLAHRDAGTADFAEFDDLNAAAQVDVTVTIGPTRLRGLLTLGPARNGARTGATRAGTTTGTTRTGTTAGPTRTDRGV